MAPGLNVNSLEFKLPDLGEGLTEAEITRWLVRVGDVVAVDQPVVEVETAKAMVEVPCPYGGVVTALFAEEGSELPVGAALLTVAVGAPAGDGTGAPAEEPADRALQTAAAEESGNVLVGYGTAAAPARRRRVRAAGVVANGAPKPAAGPASPAVRERPSQGERSQGSPSQDAPQPEPGRPVRPQEPVTASSLAASPATRTQPTDGPIPVISPLVRKLARENGVELRELTGTGPDGLILRADVEAAMAAARTAALPAAPVTSTSTATQAAAAVASEDRYPLTGIRGLVADKMARSRREIPEATCWVDADATELLAARAAMNAAVKDGGVKDGGVKDGGQKISLLALFARISVAALARYPMLNSTVDMEAREVVRLADVHLGFAAQTERGLVVPVVRNADKRTTESVNAELIRLTESARGGKLTPGELTGGTFTLNNYGVFGVDGSTPIINHPEAAMLGVGRIVAKPWVHQGELAVRHVVQLSLTFDHRVCDGGTAGGFLRFVADCVEQPAVLLRGV
ncbi:MULTISPECIES: 2-oxo acid dehydrogenase subunit E2 [Streptomyces]